MGDSRQYQDCAGSRYPTFVRNDVTLAISAYRTLVTHRGEVFVYEGEDADAVVEMISVSTGSRRQGLATEALKDLCALAEQCGVTLYIEPAPVGKKEPGVTPTMLAAWYARFGFAPIEGAGLSKKALKRVPAAPDAVPVDECDGNSPALS